MALTQIQSAALMSDLEFRGRIKVASLKFADAIIRENGDVPQHAARIRFAQSAVTNPELAAVQWQPPVVMDASIQDAGVDAQGKSLATDDAVQSALEITVLKYI